MIILGQIIKRIGRHSLRYTHSEFVRILGLLLLLSLTGTLAYSLIEGWSLLDALYATIITITTVGYGDVTPRTVEGRIFAIFFTLVAITFGGYAISSLAAYTIESRVKRLEARIRKRLMNRIKKLDRHYIVCGSDLLATRIAEEFHLTHVSFLLIDDNPEFLKKTLLFSCPEYFNQKRKALMEFYEVDLSHFESMSLSELSERLDIPYILANPTDDAILIRAGIERAAGLIAASPNDHDNLSIVIGARNLAKHSNNESLRIMTRATDPGDMRKMYLAGADHVRIPGLMGGMEMATHMLHPEMGNWWYSRARNAETTGRFVQVNLLDQPEWVGKTVGQLHAHHHTLTLSVKRSGAFVSPPPHDFELLADDILVVMRG